jgi:hypothetical protein
VSLCVPPNRAERAATVEKDKADRQAKRSENIQKRKESKPTKVSSEAVCVLPGAALAGLFNNDCVVILVGRRAVRALKARSEVSLTMPKEEKNKI